MDPSGRPPPGTRRVVLHVGTPKTGTTFLQSVLWQNRELLRTQGILVPGASSEATFLAALDLMHMNWGGEPHPRAQGRWDALVEEARDWPGTVVISQELLAGASVEEAKAAVAAFEPAEVVVVVSARDLLRQVPAEWQEHVKHGRIKSFAEFWSHLQEPAPAHELARSFRQVQDLPDVLERWAAAVPAEHYLRVVTVPPPGSPRSQLWERFVTACGFDGMGCDLDVMEGNKSLDTVTTSLLRRVNRVLIRRPLRVDQRDTLLKGLLADRVLAPLTTPAAAISVPTDIALRVRETAAEWRDVVAKRGYTVIGDLDDLVPVVGGRAGEPSERAAGPPVAPDADPDLVPAGDELRVAAQAIARLLHELGRRSDELAATRSRVRAAEQRASMAEQRASALQAWHDERVTMAPGLRLRTAVIETEDQVPAVHGVLAAYRRVRSLWRWVGDRGRRGRSARPEPSVPAADPSGSAPGAS